MKPRFPHLLSVGLREPHVCKHIGRLEARRALRPTICVIALYFLIGCLGGASAESHTLLIQGHGRCEGYFTGPTREGQVIPATAADYDFTAYLAPPSWRIRVKRHPEPDVAYHEAGAENQEEVYYLMAYSQKVIDRTEADIAAVRLANPTAPELHAEDIEIASGSVASGSYPIVAADVFLRHVWFTFASANHLDRLPPGVMEPFFDALAPFGLRTSVSLRRAAEVGLPLRAVFMSDGIIGSTRYTDAPKRFSAPYDRGFTNAVYTAYDVSNHHGVLLPSRSETIVYVPKSGGKAKSVLLKGYSIELWTTNITASSGTQAWIPELPGLTLISDWRFIADGADAVGRVMYTNTAWLPRDVVAASEELYKVRAATKALRRPQEGQFITFFRSVLVAVAILVIPIAILLKSKSTNKQ